ncbi:MAG: YwaF family protein [Erysipelotrichaceae bacterium]|jgi:ABC-2 type transport system ATP-binding protein|nr:YwaF family protein [Erysipelotrichaceae bacterium]
MNPLSLIICYVIATLVLLGLFIPIFILRFSKKDIRNKANKFKSVLKISIIILIASFTIRYFISEDPIQHTFALTSGTFIDNRIANGFLFVLVLLYFPSILITILRPFFDIKPLRVLNKYLSLPISVLSLVFLFALLPSFNTFANIGVIDWLITILLGFEVGSFVATAGINFLQDLKVDDKNNTSKRDVINIVLFGLLALIYAAPAYSLQYLFGSFPTTNLVLDLGIMHRIFIYGVIAMPIIIYLIYWYKDEKERYAVMLLLTLAGLVTFSIQFKLTDMITFIPELKANLTVLPLHLCHTAMYVVPLCLIFKKYKFFKNLFYFTYFINVFGAFMAIAMPNYGVSTAGNLFNTTLWVFWVNHFNAFVMPLLAVALKIFDRPKMKYMFWSLFFFAIYYFFILFIDVLFTNFDSSVDYFFLNSNFIPDKFGDSFEKTIMAPLVFDVGNLKFTFYPLYQVAFFCVYIAVAFGMWYVYEIGFSISDSLHDVYARLKIIKKEKLDFLSNRKIDDGGNDDMKEKHEASLVFTHFSKRYGNSDVYSANDVNLDVKGGEIFGFLGPNGAGKSTCIKTAIGIQPITSGQITVCGYDVKSEPVKAKKMIGYVPDHYALYEKLTGREYINYIADLYGVSKEDRDARIAKYIDIFELYQAFDNRIQTYSHGMKQKITIIAALVHDPKVWILDEPLTGLDPNSIFQVKECMKEHAKAGNIVFFSSHIIDVVEKLCDHIAIIKKGKILVVKNVKDIEKKESLEKYYMNLVGDNGDLEEE